MPPLAATFFDRSILLLLAIFVEGHLRNILAKLTSILTINFRREDAYWGIQGKLAIHPGSHFFF